MWRTVLWCRRTDKQVRTLHRHRRRSTVCIVFQEYRLRCKAVQRFRRKDAQVRTMRRHCRRSIVFIPFEKWRLRCKAVKGFRKKDKQVRTMHRPSQRSAVFIVFLKWRLRCSALQWFRRKEKQVRTMHRHTAEEVLYSLCCRSEGSGARQCSGFEGNIRKSEPCTGTAAELLYFLLCLRRQSMVGPVFKEGQSSKVWSKLERQRNWRAKPWAGVHIWSQTSSGNSCLEPNLERELMFGAKPRAGAPVRS